MTLTLPSDLEPFADEYAQLSGPGVYALDVQRPTDLETTWDSTFDSRPSYWAQFRDAQQVVYVGASGNVLGRLEDHRDGHVRKAVLPTIAADVSLRNVWWFDDAHTAFEQESAIALRLRNELPDTFVHFR